MGHNTSRTKQMQINHDRAAEEPAQWLVAGCQVDRNSLQIVEVETVPGAFQRGQEVLLRCRKRDCRRRVDVDLRGALEEGHADRSMKDLVQILCCGHWAGCELEEVHAIYPQGVPLVGLINHHEVLISVTCDRCVLDFCCPHAR